MQYILEHRHLALASAIVCSGGDHYLHGVITMRTRRVISHLLLVVDDAEFHSADGILNPGQQRAVATTFNTLVFRTHCPAQSPEARQPQQPAAAMVAEWAPVLLRWPTVT